MSAENPKPAASSKPPKHFLQFAQDYPEVMAAYQALGSAAHDAGPLDVKTRALIKLAIAAGARLEGAVHIVRRGPFTPTGNTVAPSVGAAVSAIRSWGAVLGSAGFHRMAIREADGATCFSSSSLFGTRSP